MNFMNYKTLNSQVKNIPLPKIKNYHQKNTGMEKILNRAADNIRVLSASMVEKAKSGHPGGAMGGADYINVLYSQFLNFDPDDMTWANRDRFFLDP